MTNPRREKLLALIDKVEAEIMSECGEGAVASVESPTVVMHLDRIATALEGIEDQKSATRQVQSEGHSTFCRCSKCQPPPPRFVREDAVVTGPGVKFMCLVGADFKVLNPAVIDKAVELLNRHWGE